MTTKRNITVKYTDGEFDFETTETNYNALLKLSVDEAYERGIDDSDVYQLNFEEWMN